MRSAGLPDRGTDRVCKIVSGWATRHSRHDFRLFQEQCEVLEEQRRQINATMERLKYKISKYEKQ